MKTKKNLNEEALAPESETSSAINDAHAPRPMAFGETMILTMKVLAAFGVLGAALWGIDLLKAVR